MKIEAGKYYRTRGGDVLGPMRKRDVMTTYPWGGPWGGGADCWTDSGRFSEDVNDCDMDLISEVYVSDTPPADAPAPEVKTLRDEFAMAALNGAMVGYHDKPSATCDNIAKWSYDLADAMMQARKK